MPKIVYEFVEHGVERVERAFSTVRKSAVEAKRANDAMAKSSGSRGPAGRQQDAHVKARDRFERESTRTKDREEKKRLRIAEQSSRREERETSRAMKRRKDMLTKHILDQQRAHREAERKQRQSQSAKFQHRSRQSAAFVGSLAGTLAARGIETGASGIGKLVELGGSAVRQRLDTKQLAYELSKSGRQSGQEGVSPEVLLREAERTAASITGTKASDIIQAQQKYVAMTGNLDEARSYGDMFATMSRASGAKESDIAASAATLQTKFGIKSKDDMQRALADLMFQGKSGAFEMSDASAYLQEMGAAGARFGLGQGSGGVRKLGALAQLARGSTGSGAEASTAVQAMLTDLTEKSAVIQKKAGVNVFADKGKTKMRDVEDIMADIMKGTKGNKAKLGDIFGERGMRGASSMVEAFNKGADAAGKNATESEKLQAGEKAMRKLFDETVNAGGSWAEVLKDASTQSQSSIDKMTTGWETFTSKAGSALEPFVKTLADGAPEFADALKPVIDAAVVLATAFGDVVAIMQEAGILRRDSSSDLTPEERISKATKRLNEIGILEKDNKGITARQRAEKQGLLDERLLAEQELRAAHPELKALDVATNAALKPGYRKLDVFAPRPFEDAMVFGNADLGKQGKISEGIADKPSASLVGAGLTGMYTSFFDSLHKSGDDARSTMDMTELNNASSQSSTAAAAQLAAAEKLAAAADRLNRRGIPGAP